MNPFTIRRALQRSKLPSAPFHYLHAPAATPCPLEGTSSRDTQCSCSALIASPHACFHCCACGPGGGDEQAPHHQLGSHTCHALTVHQVGRIASAPAVPQPLPAARLRQLPMLSCSAALLLRCSPAPLLLTRLLAFYAYPLLPHCVPRRASPSCRCALPPTLAVCGLQRACSCVCTSRGSCIRLLHAACARVRLCAAHQQPPSPAAHLRPRPPAAAAGRGPWADTPSAAPGHGSLLGWLTVLVLRRPRPPGPPHIALCSTMLPSKRNSPNATLALPAYDLTLQDSAKRDVIQSGPRSPAETR